MEIGYDPEELIRLTEVFRTMGEMQASWTDGPPVCAGYFWWRQTPGCVPEMAHVIRDSCTREHGTDSLLAIFIASSQPKPVEEIGGQWFGPIENPPK